VPLMLVCVHEGETQNFYKGHILEKKVSRVLLDGGLIARFVSILKRILSPWTPPKNASELMKTCLARWAIFLGGDLERSRNPERRNRGAPSREVEFGDVRSFVTFNHEPIKNQSFAHPKAL
jgi:hypothetical protein